MRPPILDLVGMGWNRNRHDQLHTGWEAAAPAAFLTPACSAEPSSVSFNVNVGPSNAEGYEQTSVSTFRCKMNESACWMLSDSNLKLNFDADLQQ